MTAGLLDANAVEELRAKVEPIGVVQVAAEDSTLDGRTITVRGRQLVNFGSCSYTGLETHGALRAAVVDAVHRFGTQFSSSRAFLSAPDYPAAERALSLMFGRPTAIAASTSMANMSAVPTLATPDDVILLDSQVHRSVQVAATLAKAVGTPTMLIPHSDVSALERKLVSLHGKHRRVWFMTDGLFSIFGDLAPIAELSRLVERYDNLWLYVDDAHSVSWAGRYGRGYALEHLSWEALERTVVVGSLNKSFGAAGGAMTFPDERTRHSVVSLGWPMNFSGPLQPPMLAAVLASARLHLDGEVASRQQRLVQLIRLFNRTAAASGLPLANTADTPIRYLKTGVDAGLDLVRRATEAGFFVNPVSYPAVPRKRSGLRVALTVHHTEADIDGLVAALA